MGGWVDSEASEVGEDGMRVFVSNYFFGAPVLFSSRKFTGSPTK